MDEDIVETFLLDKLGEVIKNAEAKTKEKANKLSNCKVWSAAEECEKLKKLIEDKKPNTGGVRREKLYDLLNVMAEWLQLLELLEKKRLPNGEEAAKYLCGLRARTAKIEKDLQYTTMGESEQGDRKEIPENLEIYRWSCHAVDVDKIHGFNDEMMIMKRLLLEKGSKVIVIVGAAGVGKTALSQVSFNNDEVQKKFLFRIWLCLSKQQKFDPRDLDVLFVKRILSCLGLEDAVIKEVGGGDQLVKLQLALQRELKRGEQYLIVLDDVCKIEEDPKNEEDPKMGEMIRKLFSFLTKDLSQYGADGTVIVTSRYGNLEEKGGPNNMHRLKLLPLADEDCWKIFSDSVGNGVELEPLKSKILDKCEGLPLMAKMLGEIADGKAPRRD